MVRNVPQAKALSNVHRALSVSEETGLYFPYVFIFNIIKLACTGLLVPQNIEYQMKT